MAGFQLTLHGRIWVIPEVQTWGHCQTEERRWADDRCQPKNYWGHRKRCLRWVQGQKDGAADNPNFYVGDCQL